MSFVVKKITMKHYDYIFTGAGLSSLMTVYKMALSGDFSDKKILLIDSNNKKANDRTWCFWGDGGELFGSIIYKSWHTAIFKDNSKSVDLDFGQRKYNMIRGIDFYNFVFDELENHPNIKFVNEESKEIEILP